MGRYRPEDIGRDVAHLHTNFDERRGRGLIVQHDEHPNAAIQLVEVLPALEATRSKGESGRNQKDQVNDAAGKEHQPLRIPWSCDVKTHKVTYRYPDADHRVELAREAMVGMAFDPDALGDTVEKAREDNSLVRIYRKVAWYLNDQHPPPKPALVDVGPARRGICPLCDLRIEGGQAWYQRGEVWCENHGRYAWPPASTAGGI